MRSMLKKTLALILCLVMCLSLFPTAAFADAEIPEEAPLPPLEGEVAAEQPEGSDSAEDAEPVILSDSEESPTEDPAAPAEDDAPPEEPADPVGDDVLDVPEDAEDPMPLPEGEAAAEQPEGLDDAEAPADSVGDDALGVPENGVFDDPFALVEADEPQGTVASGTCGENLTWSLDDAGTLTISGTGGMSYDFVTVVFDPYDPEGYGSPPWENLRDSIKAVDLQSGVTGIGDHAFFGCSNLTSIEIPSGVTSIGRAALSRCSSLTSINVAEDNQYFSSRDGVLFNKAQTELRCCPGGKAGSYSIPAGVTSIADYAFSGCCVLTSVEIPNGVTSIGYSAFSNCGGLTYVVIPESLNQMNHDPGDDFYPRLDGIFENCSGLKSAGPIGGGYNIEFCWTGEIPDAAFYGCSSLTSITLPGGLTRIGYQAFYRCSSLTTIIVLGAAPGNASAIFRGLYASTTVWYPAKNSTWNAVVTSGDKWHPYGTGWQELGGKWFYFNSDGVMKTGWLKSGSSWFYMGADGAMKTGWQQVGGSTYYFDSDGGMLTGWQELGGSWYYFQSSGAMKKGWLKSGSSWFYMGTDGVMKTGWVEYNVYRFYFKSDGTMAIGWTKVEGKWYYMDEEGILQTGWVKSGGKWYYMDSSGAMKTGWVKSGGKWYYMDSSGAMKTGWVKSGGKWYYMDSSGAMKTGWLKSGGKWYYLDSDGAMLASTSRTINGKTYNFNASGVCTNP